jgi:hypothetical protein
MPNNVTSTNDAVALLMYHCGVAVNMDYGISSSGAYVIIDSPTPNANSEYAYKTYFGYDASTIQGLKREYYSNNTWIQMLKDDLEFNNQTDEATLVELAKNTNHSHDEFIIEKQLIKLFPDKKEHQLTYEKSLKKQANQLIDAHEKMLLPMPLGNYRYVKSVKFAKEKANDKKYVLVLTLTSIFDKKLKAPIQKKLKHMFQITHDGMYKHYGFDKMRLILVPTFDSLDEVEIVDLNRTASELPEMGLPTNVESPEKSE